MPMYKLKKCLSTAAGLLTVALVLTLTQVGDVEAQAIKDVLVVNPPAQPIPTTVQMLPPITGSVSVANTPTVNLPPGTTVGISSSNNTVQVGGVVSVREVRNPANQPVELLIATTFPSGLFIFDPIACIFVGGICIGPTVPAGKRLVIESAGADIRVPPGQRVGVSVLASRAGRGITYPLPTTNHGTFSGQDIFQGAQPLRLYADPGMSVGAVVQRDSNTGQAGVFVTFSGHFVDIP